MQIGEVTYLKARKVPSQVCRVLGAVCAGLWAIAALQMHADGGWETWGKCLQRHPVALAAVGRAHSDIQHTP